MSTSDDALLVQAAQRALRDASRRRKLAATVVSNPADKRSRAPATSSTKVTPDGKKQCSSSVVADNLQPRCLSFSDDVTAGDDPSGADPNGPLEILGSEC